VHEQNDYHLNPEDTIQQIFNGPYWWPTITQDTEYYINGEYSRCKRKTTTKIQCGAITTNPQVDWRTPFIDYLSHGRLTTPATTSQRQQIAIRSRPFQLIHGDQLIKERADGMKMRCVSGPITEAIIAEAHEGIAGGYFAANITLHKILTALYWWPTMKMDVYMYCKQCDICQRVEPKVSKSAQPLHPIMPTEVFQRWGLDFIGPINPPAKGTKNRYIITATDYTIKWVEARVLKDNTAASTAKFIFKEIITKFGCPIELVSDQESHFLNETIQILTKKFMVLHRKSTTYYPQANGQAENTNKVIKTTLTKMVNANRTDWDTKLYAALWAYRTAYKVTTKHTPFSLVFGTEALLPLTFIYHEENLQRSQEWHPVLKRRMEQLKTLDLIRIEAEENIEHTQTMRKRRHDKTLIEGKKCKHFKKPSYDTKEKTDNTHQARENSQQNKILEFYKGQKILWHQRMNKHGPGKFRI
jgi:hypothetical protein